MLLKKGVGKGSSDSRGINKNSKAKRPVATPDNKGARNGRCRNNAIKVNVNRMLP